MNKYQKLLALLVLFAFSPVMSMEVENENQNQNLRGWIPSSELLSRAMVAQEKHEEFKDDLQKLSLNKKDDSIIELLNMESYPVKLVYDQGNLGACTAHALGFAIRYLSVFHSKMPNVFSKNPERIDIARLFQYYNSRYLEGQYGQPPKKQDKIDKLKDDKVNNNTKKPDEYYTQEEYIYILCNNDWGSSLTSTVLACDVFGEIREVTDSTKLSIDVKSVDFQTNKNFDYKGCSYDVANFKKHPSPLDYRSALDDDWNGVNEDKDDGTINKCALISKAIRYHDIAYRYRTSVNDVSTTEEEKNLFHNDLMKSLKKNHPVLMGLLVDAGKDSKTKFEPGPWGRIPTPPNDIKEKGGHALCLVGYGDYFKKDGDTTPYYKFMNSWGWDICGMGYVYLKPDYVLNVKTFKTDAISVRFDSKIWNGE